MNLYYISRCTKSCPNCQFSIAKIDGCNKMICTRCGIFFCWMCLENFKGYEHFTESPQCGDIILADISHNLAETEAMSSEFSSFQKDLSREESKIFEKAL